MADTIFNSCQQVSTKNTVVVLYMILDGAFLIFERDDGHIGPLSGKVNPDEGLRSAAKRELREETGLPIDLCWLFHTGHYFHGISPKGKRIFGVSLFAVLNNRSFDISKIKLSGELLDYQLVPPDVAIGRIQKYGHPESLPGIMCVLKENLAIKNGKRNFNGKGDSYEKEISMGAENWQRAKTIYEEDGVTGAERGVTFVTKR